MVSGYGIPVIALLWGVCLSISIFHLLVHKAPLLPTILGQWSLLGASLIYGGVGYYISQNVDTSQEHDQIAVYSLGIFSLAGLASGGYATHQYLSPITVLPIEGVVFQAIFVALIGGTIGMFIGRDMVRRDRTTDQLTALNNLHEIARDINQELAEQTTREDIERAVCERLAESDSYKFAWVGVTDEQTQEVIPSTTANTQGYLDDVTITVDDSETGNGPTGKAFRTEESQIVRNIHTDLSYRPWRAKAGERGINCSAAIPITYEDHFYGVLNIYTAREYAFDGDEQEVVIQLGEIVGLAIAAVEHEQQLEHERERLEFINRLLRHALLNGLNAVRAHVDNLEPCVDPEGRDSLQTIQRRTDDMSELIQTLRSLMQTIVEDGEPELKSIDLGEVLRAELEKARQTYDQAQFEVKDDLMDCGFVMADELLGVVFENVLANAVQHNDSDVPQVTLTVETTDEVATVRIADNGPGMCEDLKECVFEQGEKYFESPDTGFGLYLTQEIVETYGGTISVADNEPEGTVFSISLQICEEKAND